eukprot:scaffold151124_cov55-Attheya_sp.AAC.5
MGTQLETLAELVGCTVVRTGGECSWEDGSVSRKIMLVPDNMSLAQATQSLQQFVRSPDCIVPQPFCLRNWNANDFNHNGNVSQNKRAIPMICASWLTESISARCLPRNLVFMFIDDETNT